MAKPGELRRRAQLQKQPRGGGVKGDWALGQLDQIVKLKAVPTPPAVTLEEGTASRPVGSPNVHGRPAHIIVNATAALLSGRLRSTFQSYISR